MSTAPTMVANNFYSTGSNSSLPDYRTHSNPSNSDSHTVSSPHYLISSQSSLQGYSGNSYHDYSSSMLPADSISPDVKPFSLPSLSSITSQLSGSSPETSLVGPHRTNPSLSCSTARRFSPLSTSLDCSELISPVDSERSSFNMGDRRTSGSGMGMNIATGHRPRSRSILSGQSFTNTQLESELPNDESASDSGGSDKKRDSEDQDTTASAKKRSRTLTTPSQQRRLMQILEQTRFPSTELREQLARELGMTPRRVQIWFQNRRQGMKKAMEQKAEHDATAATAAEFNRTRGYSFGAYPTPPSDLFQAQRASYTSFGNGGVPLYPTPGNHGSQNSLDNFPHQPLYASRSLARSSLPRQLPQLQLVTNSATTPSDSAAAAEFSWSESSAASTAYSSSSAVERERMGSSFGKSSNQTYDNCAPSNFALPAPTTRNRSQTNPGFFGLTGMHGLAGSGHLSHHSISTLETTASRAAQKYVALDSVFHPSKSESWPSTFSQPVWSDELTSIKLESTPYSTERQPQSQHASDAGSSAYPAHAETSAGFCYADNQANQPSNLFTKPYSFAEADPLESNEYTSATAGEIALHHNRQRSRSFTG